MSMVKSDSDIYSQILNAVEYMRNMPCENLAAELQCELDLCERYIKKNNLDITPSELREKLVLEEWYKIIDGWRENENGNESIG